MFGWIGVNKSQNLHIYLEKDIKSWNLAQVSYFRREAWWWHPFSQFGVKGSLKDQKLPFSLQRTIKSWYYVQVSCLRQDFLKASNIKVQDMLTSSYISWNYANLSTPSLEILITYFKKSMSLCAKTCQTLYNQDNLTLRR